MAKRPNLGQINSTVFTVTQLNSAYTKIDEAFDNTLSRDGSTPNTMLADLDMNSNSLLNVDDIQSQTITVESAIIGGKEFVGTITWRASWLTSTAYDYLDVVNKDGVLYICLEAHTSDVFMTDLTNTKWEVFISNTTGPTGDPGADGTDGQGVPVGGTAGQVLAKIDGTDYNTEWVDVSGGAGVTDGDKGDITVSGSGATWTIDNGVVSLAKMANMATSSLVYRRTAGSGAPEVNTLATLKTDLGLTGTNSGDQTITLTGMVTGSGTGSFATSLGSFTKAQLDTAVSDGNVMYVGDAPTAHTHTLANITDVTMTLANLNSLDDGANSTLHFHNTDRDRANHTGTQLAATISDFAEAVDDRVSSLLVAGSNVTLTYNDAANTLTVAASGVSQSPILAWMI
jgi:hypothetical protein